MLPDFNRLKIFYFIYKTQSSTQAAKELHLTQSCVSQHLKKLEEELQLQLFIRDKRQLVPTAAGNNFYKIVHGFISELEEYIGQTTHTPFRVGAPIEFGKTYFSGIMSSYLKSTPHSALQMELGSPQKLFRMLSEGELDFAYIDILPFPVETPKGLSSYSITPLIKEEFYLICSEEYYDSYVDNENLETLEELDYISYKPDTSLFNSWFKMQFDSEPESIHVPYVIDSAQGIINAVKENLGLGLVVSHLVGEELKTGELKAIKGTGKHLNNTIALVQLKNKTMTIAEKEFQGTVLDELRKIPELKFEQ